MQLVHPPPHNLYNTQTPVVNTVPYRHSGSGGTRRRQRNEMTPMMMKSNNSNEQMMDPTANCNNNNNNHQVETDPLALLSCSSLGDGGGWFNRHHYEHQRIVKTQPQQQQHHTPYYEQQQAAAQHNMPQQQEPWQPQRKQRTCSSSTIQTPWPTHIAKQVSEKVHHHVQQLLSESRLGQYNSRNRNNNNNNNHPIRLVNHTDIECVERVLGRGAFSQVSAVVLRNDDNTNRRRRYACKHLKESLMTERGVDDFCLAASELACEAHILSSLDHPNIMKIRGWTQNGIASFESGRHDSFFLLLDVLEETLDQRIDRWKKHQHDHISSTTTSTTSCLGRMVSTASNNLQYQTLYLEKIRILGEITSALSYIHSHGIIFRDLKPNNIGFDEDGRCVLFDFGLSRELPTLDTSVPFAMSGKVGTLRYMAPEIARCESYNVSADVYSWAMVAYEVLSLAKPFDGWTRDMHADLVCGPSCARPNLDANGANNHHIHHRHYNRHHTSSTTNPQSVPDEMKVILERTWHAQPSHRGTAAQLCAQLAQIESRQIAIVAEQELQHDFQQQEFEYERQQEEHRQQQQLLNLQQYQPQPQQAHCCEQYAITNMSMLQTPVAPVTPTPTVTLTSAQPSIYVDMPICSVIPSPITSPPPTTIMTTTAKLCRSMSMDSIETIDTETLSSDSLMGF